MADSLVKYSLDQYNLPLFSVADPRFSTLGGWIISDISVFLRVCLDALANIDDAAHARPVEPWGSDEFDVVIDADGPHFRNRYADMAGDYSLAHTRGAVEDYWTFLVARPEKPGLERVYWPELPRPEAEVLLWEKTWKRPHPYRGVLF